MPQSGIREIFDKAQQYDNLADLSIGEPDFTTAAPIANTVGDAIGDGISSYTPTIGRADLRTALAEKLATENGININPDEELLVTPGAMGALFTAMQVLFDPGDEVLVPEPYWPNYHGHLVSAGAELIPVPTTAADRFVPNSDALAAAASEDTVGVILNTPNNPTGAVIPPNQLRAIGTVLVEEDLWAVVDETYEDLLYDDAVHYSLASNESIFERCVTVHSFSKSYAMTGWRIGYVSGPESVVSAMRVLQEHTISCVPEPAQIAAMAALDNRTVVNDIHDVFTDRRELILERLEAISGVKPGRPRGAFYVFADISDISSDSRAFVETLLDEAQVAAIPGSVFGDTGEGHIRFSYATDEATIEKAMDRFEQAVDGR
ncbi:pyridoxal phosphate-dependent aminotransferase [Halococcus sp. AFM35]|uniref:pyridoxal phosphate-dependent aminotransferase n=1 Tax=Halococcus sp. AFM35 TaxID=3421653 RepID=UPI003EC07C7D